jgi:hypothetical protein
MEHFRILLQKPIEASGFHCEKFRWGSVLSTPAEVDKASTRRRATVVVSKACQQRVSKSCASRGYAETFQAGAGGQITGGGSIKKRQVNAGKVGAGETLFVVEGEVAWSRAASPLS